VDWITAKAANNTAVNPPELLHECNERFGKSITRGWVDSFLMFPPGYPYPFPYPPYVYPFPLPEGDPAFFPVFAGRPPMNRGAPGQ
jgi:hypothetical protein